MKRSKLIFLKKFMAESYINFNWNPLRISAQARHKNEQAPSHFALRLCPHANNSRYNGYKALPKHELESFVLGCQKQIASSYARKDLYNNPIFNSLYKMRHKT